MAADEMKVLVESALKLKAENEHLHELVDEARRLLKLCHTEDRSDLALTFQMLKGLLLPAVH